MARGVAFIMAGINAGCGGEIQSVAQNRLCPRWDPAGCSVGLPRCGETDGDRDSSLPGRSRVSERYIAGFKRTRQPRDRREFIASIVRAFDVNLLNILRPNVVYDARKATEDLA